MSDLCHITLTTGDVRRSPRTEVGDDALAIIRPLLFLAIDTHERVPLPHPPGYSISATAGKSTCLVTLWGAQSETALPQSVPLLTTGIAAADGDKSAQLWRMLGGVASPPPAPWCADRIEFPLAHMEAYRWTGDYSRCVAWAWLERSGLGCTG